MASNRIAKSPLKVIHGRFSYPAHPKYDYPTKACRKGTFITDTREFNSFSRSCASHPCSLGMLLRRFCVQAAASTQMDLIKHLRARTCAPIKDVKSSLVDCNWDIEAAQKELRRRGVVLASKKSGRTASEGLLALAQTDGTAAIVELNCETDFVARNEIFQYLATSLAKLALLSLDSSQRVSAAFPLGRDYFKDLNISLDHPKLSGDTTVHNAVTEVAAMVGENVRVRRGFVMSASSRGVLSAYLHSCLKPGLGRIAGILSLESDGESASLDGLRKIGSDLAMHVVAANPLFLMKDNVSSDALETERDIFMFQAESTGKPQTAMEKMVEGRLRKYMEEVVLMEQKYVLQDTINIKMVLDNLSKEVGCSVKVGNFVRMEAGEGIERLKTSDASDSVAEAC